MIYLAIVLSFLSACAKELPSIKSTNSNSAATNFSSNADVSAPVIDAGKINDVLNSVGPYFLKANYKIKVRALNIDFCKTEVQMAVSTKLGMDGNPAIILNKHVIPCALGIKLDLLPILAGLGIHIGDINDVNSVGNPGVPSNDVIIGQMNKFKEIVSLKADKMQYTSITSELSPL